MSAEYVLATLKARGCQLICDGNQLRVRAPEGALTGELRRLLRVHKPDLLRLLDSDTPAHDADTPSPTPPALAAPYNSQHRMLPSVSIANNNNAAMVTSSSLLEVVPTSHNSRNSHNSSWISNSADSANCVTEQSIEHQAAGAAKNGKSILSSKATALTLPPDIAYHYITEAEEARHAVSVLLKTRIGIIGVDTETTGLDPIQDELRLLQLAVANDPVLVIDIVKIGGLQTILDLLSRLFDRDGAHQCVAHNAVFEMKFFGHNGLSALLDCTMLAYHVLTGNRSKLDALAKMHLNIGLDKTLQQSDWSQPELTAEQLRYAALDAEVVRRLHPMLQSKLDDQNSRRVYELMVHAQPAIVAMELAGMPFDRTTHRTLIAELKTQFNILSERFREVFGDVNPNSGSQIAAWLIEKLGGLDSEHYEAWPKTAKGQLKTGKDELLFNLYRLRPDDQRNLQDIFLPYKKIDKLLSTYGDKFTGSIHPVTGCIHANFNLAGTRTGRISCSGPNLQQIPSGNAWRGLFKAPEGRCFVVADYSQIELRVAAIVAQEASLLEAYRRGDDVHRLTAAMILGKEPSEVTKDERQSGKALNFGLLYGQGSDGLRKYAVSGYDVVLTPGKAKQYRKKLLDARPGLKCWQLRNKYAAKRNQPAITPCGRVRHNVTFTEMCNTPIQGAAAEIILAALGALMQKNLDAQPIAVIHDEIIVEADVTQAEYVKCALEEAMVEGMLSIFPEASTVDLVKAQICNSWADK